MSLSNMPGVVLTTQSTIMALPERMTKIDGLAPRVAVIPRFTSDCLARAVLPCHWVRSARPTTPGLAV